MNFRLFLLMLISYIISRCRMCEVILYYLMKCDGGEVEGKEIEILIDCCEIFYCFKFLKL